MTKPTAGGNDDYRNDAGHADHDAVADHDALLADLADDFLRRHRAGEGPSPDDYCAEHPDLADRIRRLFPAALAMEQAGLGVAVDVAPPAERIGATIGRYKLLERIGEGGFGVVYMAEQLAPVRRKVALKVIKPGMDSAQVIARFEAERQALALMDHPNIARVLDAGATDAGRPYFVMELVRGTPVTDYCDASSLSTRERLGLFVHVCNAVQHAHTKGVIHRDLKPTNVLVTLHDGAPLPKVIDFGVAKAVGQQLTDKTLFTHFAQMVGTPAYMSPEQAAMSSGDVDTRSDVYSLGVLLYELLTGTTPFNPRELRAAAHAEIQRIIREVQPPRPSTRLSALGESLGAVAARRGTDPAKLGRMVRGELDWVVMKCLEKDRSRRYETADRLARDVERYLHDKPVEASPPTAAYRLRKFVKRNKGTVAAAGLVLATLLAGIVGTSWGMVRAAQRADGQRRAREEAQSRLAQVEKANDLLAAIFEGLDPAGAERAGISLRHLLSRRLDDAARQLERDAVSDPLVVARLQHALGISLFELGQTARARDVLVKASRTRERTLGADHVETAATAHRLAAVYRELGEYALAERLYDGVIAVRTVGLGADHSDTLASRHDLANVYFGQLKYAAAEALLKDVLARRTATLGALDAATLTTRHRLAALAEFREDYAQTETLHKELLAVRTATRGADSLDAAATKANLASVYRAQGKFDLAEPLYNEVIAVRTEKRGPDHPYTLNTRHQLATLYLWRGEFDRAEALTREVLALRIAARGPDHPETLASKYELARVYQWRGKFEQAEALYKEALASFAATLGADHRDALATRHELAALYAKQGRDALAESLFKEVLAAQTARLGADDLDTLATLHSLADLYHWRRHDHARAEPMYREVLAGRTARLGPYDLLTSDAQHSLAELYRNQGNFDLAESMFKQVLASRTARYGARHQDTLFARFELAILYQWMKEPDRSIPFTEELVKDAKATAHPATLRIQALLGALYCDAGRFADAARLLEEVHQANGRDPRLTPAAEAVPQLVRLYEAWGKPDEAAKWRRELAAQVPTSSRPSEQQSPSLLAPGHSRE